MKFLSTIFLSLIAVSNNISFAESRYNCQGFICSLNIPENEIKNYFQCPGPDFPHINSVTFLTNNYIYRNGYDPLVPPSYNYQSIKFDVNFQPPEYLELKASDQYECAEMKTKYSDLFSFIFESDWHFRFPATGYVDKFSVFGNKIYKVETINSSFNVSNGVCTLETNYKNTRFNETFSAENGDRDFRIRFMNINDKLIYTNNYPKILEMFKSSINLTVTGIR
jgi:hypothetical protein